MSCIASTTQRMVAVVRIASLPPNYGIPTPLHIWAVIYKHSICRGPISDNSSLESVDNALVFEKQEQIQAYNLIQECTHLQWNLHIEVHSTSQPVSSKCR